jgi:hypothetical protein
MNRRVRLSRHLPTCRVFKTPIRSPKLQFSTEEVRDSSSYPWVTQTLLHFFGVLTYAEEAEGTRVTKHRDVTASAKFLTIPNKTMQYLVCFTIASQL